MARSLVIVESPAKAKTINKFLGRGFVVKASMGHVRDLPKRTLGVDEKDFTPTYVALPEKKKTLVELKKAVKDVDMVFLAADPDREGEAICWHLKEELSVGLKIPFQRVMFNEITKKAILEAFEHPREIDAHKVDAQQARRILDRFVGYKISPLLWDKVRRGLSAGRVQSVAMRIIVEREREILAFVPKEYWSLTAQLWAGESPQFGAKLIAKNGKKIEVVSQDEMRAALGELGWDVAASKPVSEDASALILEVKAARPDPVPFKVAKIASQEKKKNPAPPFITSKLQQDAARQLGFPVAKTMRLAQGLYEGREIGDAGTVGLITYMRTDSTRTSDEALDAVRAFINETYGAPSLPKEPRKFKVGKAAQEAHEAIRPTSLEFTPDRVKDFLGRDEYRLYQLIWNRFVASQMETAIFDTTRADIEAGPFTFRATGSVLKFAGWLAVYHEGKDEDAPAEDQRAPEAESEDDEERRLPKLSEGPGPRLAVAASPPALHATASAIFRSDAREGTRRKRHRPSIHVCGDHQHDRRSQLRREGKGRFHPTELGLLVNDLMVASFDDIVDVGYTARMEEQLDEIEEGRLNWVEALREFQTKFEADLVRAKKEMRDVKREAIPTDQVCDKCGKPMVLKWGRFGQFLACSGYPECKNTREIGSVSAEPDTAARPTACLRRPRPRR
jgi:DNA topoisomerase-1